MADSENGPGRKLPPISPRAKNPDTDAPVKPVRKKKKKPAADPDIGSGTEDAKPTPRRRRRTPSASRDTDGEDKPVEETTTPAPKKKKKKAKPKEPAAETEDQPVSDRSATRDEDVTGSKASLITKESKEGTPRKKGKKKKVVKKKTEEDEYADSGLAADLTSIEEDIIKDEDQKEDIELPQTTNVGVLRSQPTQKIYVETIGGFKKENKTKLAKRLAAEEAEKKVESEASRKTTIELALTTYRIMKTVTLFIHGLTAGLALWQIIIVYILSSFGNTDFLEHYQSLSLPVQCCAYLLLALCVVSTCDRFDIGYITRRFLLRAFTLQNGAVSIIFYLTAVILSVSIVSTEDKIHLHNKNPDLWADADKTESELSLWRRINTARGVFAILGWLVLSITPNADRLSHNLREGDDDELLGKEQAETGVSAA
ncbi:LOW QUALITY PROTEIN: transmembrane protein 237-like [Haliotis rubra]|uniref:LOW QUALITY PROTEIN: transmembrane protein 237-like n=1 Tax=Haliotis rubra TaxID=36100 RepID=UPI001EE581FD|nr:LOW QUALITY PROTEIN: transmembrane protein 237-like [Haliotis rubra]